MAFETVAEFLDRLDARYAGDLTSTLDGGTPSSPANQARITKALDDATAELQGYLPRVATEHRPSVETLRVHCHKVALYLLTLNRPGAEFEAIRNAYTDTIGFYTKLIEQAAATGGATSPLEGSACIPAAAFNSRSLKGFT